MNVDKIEDDIRLFKADFKQHPHEFLRLNPKSRCIC